MELKGNIQLRVAQEGSVKELFKHLSENASVYFIVEDADLDFCLEEVSKTHELSYTDDFCIVSTKGPENFLNIPNLTNLVCLDNIEDEMDESSVMIGMLNTVMSDFQEMINGDNESSMRILKKFVNSNSPYWRNIFGMAPKFQECLIKFVNSLSDQVNKEITEGRALLNENTQELLTEKDKLISAANEKMKELEIENQKKNALIEELEEKISILENQASEQDGGISSEVVESLRTELEELKKKENILTESLNEKEYVLSEKDSILSEKDLALSEKINLIEELQVKLVNLQKESENANNAFTTKINELQDKYNGAIQFKEELEKTEKILQEEKAEIESELERLKTKLNNPENNEELEKLTKRVSELENELQKYVSLREGDSDKINKLEEERNYLKAQIEEMKNIGDNSEEIKTLNSIILDKETEIEKLKSEFSSLEELGSDVEEINKQLEVKDNVINSLKEKLSANEELLKNVSSGGSVNIDELAEKEREIKYLNAVISEMKKKETGEDTNPFERNIVDTSFGKKYDKEDLLQTIKGLEEKLSKKDSLIEELNKQIANLTD